MPEPVTAILGGISAISGVGSAVVQGSAASKAANAQQQAAMASVAEQRAAREELRKLLGPYAQGGPPAFLKMMDIAGLNEGRMNTQAYLQNNPDVAAEWQRIQGEGRFANADEYAQWHYDTFGKNEGRQIEEMGGQQAAINALEQSPMFQALARQGEDAILQSASATGGLRGGNTQGALARFRPQLLNQFVEQQYGRLSDIASRGQNAAAGVGAGAQQTAGNIGNILQNAGMAQAAGYGAQGQIFGNLIGNLGGQLSGVLANSNFGRGNIYNNAAQTVKNNPGIF